MDRLIETIAGSVPFAAIALIALRHRPAAAIGWSVLILIDPWIGLACYLTAMSGIRLVRYLIGARRRRTDAQTDSFRENP